jgi:hypothetical protein
MQKVIVLRRTPPSCSRSITMRRAVAAVRHSPEASTREAVARTWRGLSKALTWRWRAFLGGEGVYRPHLHYMRGPGPAWHAKHSHLASYLRPRCNAAPSKRT